MRRQQREADEVDLAGGVIRLPPARSKTRTGRVLPTSTPLADVLTRKDAAQNAGENHAGRQRRIAFCLPRT